MVRVKVNILPRDMGAVGDGEEVELVFVQSLCYVSGFPACLDELCLSIRGYYLCLRLLVLNSDLGMVYSPG